MLKLVIDTNLLVSAVFWGGTPGRLLNLVLQRQVRMCTGDWMMDEWRSVAVLESFEGILIVTAALMLERMGV